MGSLCFLVEYSTDGIRKSIRPNHRNDRVLLETPARTGRLDYRELFLITEGFDTWDKPGFVAADEFRIVAKSIHKILSSPMVATQ